MRTWFGTPASPSAARIGARFAKACARIHAESFPHPWDAEEFESLLAGRDVLAHAATLPRRLPNLAPRFAGFILSRQAADEAEILTVAVTPRARQRGVGAALLSAHLPALAACGVNSLFLEVEAGNRAALRLYENYGFRQVGRREAYYRGGDGSRAAALVLRRDLA